MHIHEGESTPQTAVLEELDKLHGMLHEITRRILAVREEDIRQLRARVERAEKKLSQARLMDLRDMLTVLRKTEFKPGKGRRRDLRKIDDMIEDLKILTENWSG